MKLKHLLSTVVFTALAAPSLFAAPTVIHVAASNGDRGPTQTAISKLLAANGAWTFQGTSGASSNVIGTTNAVSSNFGVWNGTYNGVNVVIKTSYLGALGAVATVAGNTTIRYVVGDGTGSTALPDPNLGTTEGVDYELSTADFGFSTNFQSTSPFQGVYQGVTYSALQEDVVGVSPLGFYASPGFPTSAANITTQQAQLLYSTGVVSLALFTGDYANDANKLVYAIGRNTDAGQRFGAYAEVGLGTTSTVKVWQPTFTGQTTSGSTVYGGTSTSHIPWPEESPSGIYSQEGNGGYPTGATLAPSLTSVLGVDAYKSHFTTTEGDEVTLYPNATAGYYIGYLTPGDALTRVLGVSGAITDPAKRGVALSYNGVKLHNDFNGPGATVNTANVQSGKYTAWLYNRQIRRPGTPSLAAGTTTRLFADALRTQISTVDGVVGGGLLNDANFKVKRSTDGGLVIPK